MAEAGLPREQAEAIVETVAQSQHGLMSKAVLQSTVDQLEARLTVRIVTAQVATATLLFLLLKLFG